MSTLTQMRDLALSVSADDLGLSVSEKFPESWGVVMEQTIFDVPVVVVVLAEGSTSLYFGDQSGFIGTGGYPQVREWSDYLLTVAQIIYPVATPVSDYEATPAGITSFTFRGWKGNRRCYIETGSPGEKGSPGYALYFGAESVISAIREVEQSGVPKRPVQSPGGPE